MFTASQLAEELEGSKFDIKEACSNIQLHITDTTPSWCNELDTQIHAIFEITLKAPPTDDNNEGSKQADKEMLYVACCLPKGYALLNLDMTVPHLTPHSAYSFVTPIFYYEQLHLACMKHPTYRALKEQELLAKMMELANERANDEENNEQSYEEEAESTEI